MPDQYELTSIDELINAYSVIAPLWDDDVWTPLQARDFGAAEARLQNKLAGMSAEEWGGVFWTSIVGGAPAMRGGVDLTAWRTRALPAIGAAAVKAATPAKLAAAYNSIDVNFISEFHEFIVGGVPGDSPKEKSEWLEKNQKPVFNFLLASPAGIHFSRQIKLLSGQNKRRLSTVPEKIRVKVFDFQTAEIVRKAAEQNNLPPEKISQAADAVGLVFLGYLHPEDLSKEISEHAGIPAAAAQTIAEALNKKLFDPIREDLDKTYAPLPHDHETEEEKPPVVVEEVRKPEGQKPYAAGRAEPLDITKIFGAQQAPSEKFGGRAPQPPRAVPPAPKPDDAKAGKPFGAGDKPPVSEFERLGLKRETRDKRQETTEEREGRVGGRQDTREKGRERKEVDKKEAGDKRVEGPALSSSAGLTAGHAEGPALSRAEGPTMLHKESEAKPGPTSKFKIDLPPALTVSDEGPKKAPPPEPAKLEFGPAKSSAAPPAPPRQTFPQKNLDRQTKPPAPKPPRVVNYADLKTPVDRNGLPKPPSPFGAASKPSAVPKPPPAGPAEPPAVSRTEPPAVNEAEPVSEFERLGLKRETRDKRQETTEGREGRVKGRQERKEDREERREGGQERREEGRERGKEDRQEASNEKQGTSGEGRDQEPKEEKPVQQTRGEPERKRIEPPPIRRPEQY